MGTVPGSPPGSCRPLAGTMGRGTWHTPPPPSICFVSWSGGLVCSHTTHRWCRPPPCTPAGRETPQADSQARATCQARPAHPSGLGAGASSQPALGPGPSRRPAPDAGPANSHPVPQPRPQEHGSASVRGLGTADTHLSHQLPRLSQAAWWGETWREGTWREAPGGAEAGGPQKGQHAGLARTPPHVFRQPAKRQR